MWSEISIDHVVDDSNLKVVSLSVMDIIKY